MKQNCWEIKKCGREKGGAKTKEFGICPVSERKSANGINGGKNGGRICWAISHTYCDDKIQGNLAEKQLVCVKCEVFKRVQQEEGDGFYLINLKKS